MADVSKLKSQLPHRAEHIGSLLRPRELRDAFKAHAAGQMSDAAYREVEDRNILEAIRMQEEAGLATISDGEFRRGSWAFGLVKAVEGFGEARSMFEFHDAAGNSYPFDTCYAVAKIRRSRPIAVGEFEFVRRHTERVPKVTMPAPSFMHFFRGKACADPAVYPEVAVFWADLLRVYHEELAELGRAGAQYLQIDEVPLAMLCDPAVRDRARAIGEDPDALATMYINAVNDVVSARPQGMTVGMHLCRGNLRSRWLAAGSYEAVAERLFNETRVDAFFLEYDTPRAGDFAPLRFMAKDKTVVLGLVSTKTPVLEDAEALRRRIDEAARHVPLERLALSPQCGFASTVGGNLLSIDDERRKLGLVVEVAQRIWGQE
jgi:5-methyltetrahydropteroyltriglutamate--homocysteine methyltransferase